MHLGILWRNEMRWREMAMRAVVNAGRGRTLIPHLIKTGLLPASRVPFLHTNSNLRGGNIENVAAFKHQIRAINTETSVEIKASGKEDEPSPEDWKIKMLYDGECPLCLKEVNMLKERNKSYGTIKFVDICSDEYSPEENLGIDYETAMGKIHAIQSDGTVVTDVEAFRRLYEEVGLGWVYAITKYEPIASIANAVYGVWAKYRMEITGRPSLDEVFEARRKNRGQVCKDKSCDI